MPDILLTTINAKWIHPSLALRLLKANLGNLSSRCEIIEFALRQPLREKVEPVLAAMPRILGVSVSIWNHSATLELLKELEKSWSNDGSLSRRPFIVLGGPEVSYLPHEAEIFRYAHFCIRGEGELAFRELCEYLLSGRQQPPHFVCSAAAAFGNFYDLRAKQVDVCEIKTAYHLYSDEDLRQKLVYVEAGRGCPFACTFCTSGYDGAEKHTDANFPETKKSGMVREFPLEPFLAEMDDLVRRGARTFKFLDRTFNLNIERAQRIMAFYLKKIKERKTPLTVHFEMVPSRFPPELLETLSLFPPGSLRLEIGIQTLNPDIAAHIGRPCDPEKELATLHTLRKKTSAIIHADLIAGLPGEDLASFGRGFDMLWDVLYEKESEKQISTNCCGGSGGGAGIKTQPEIQPGILKVLPGAPIARLCKPFEISHNLQPPYEVISTAALPEHDMTHLKYFARFWELIVNRGLCDAGPAPVFDRFMHLAGSLLAHFGRSWGIDKNELREYACSKI